MSDNADDERFFRSLERLPLKPFDREFAENEEEEFLDNFCVILGDYLNPSHAKYWRADYPAFSQQWKDRQDKTRYLERAIERTSLMVTSRDWDPAPLLWMKHYINGAKQRDAGRIDEIRYLVGRLHLVVCGKETKWLRTYDESAAPVQSDSLELHSTILEAFELATKAGWWAVDAERPLEEVRSQLDLLKTVLAAAPSVDGLATDFRLLPFRRARLAIKPASESAIMLEPAFCDPVITREKSFASYHDAALNLAAEMAEVLEAEVNSIRQENRLSPEEMCRTASLVPHEHLGTEGVYWLRIASVYEEYRAGMISEAANIHSDTQAPPTPSEVAERDKQAAEQGPPTPNSRPMSKKDAAKLHNRGIAVENPTDYFKALVASGHLTAPAGKKGAKLWRFVVEEFPESARDDMR